ncbi:MAG: EAL domain-containing protein [Lachnospiraceae bacterium]|nr:EAL domain-containing protein [Lachnospiraceae bacterium]
MNAIIWFDVAAVCLLMIEWYILFLRRHVVSGQIRRFRLTMALITIATVSDLFCTLADIEVYRVTYQLARESHYTFLSNVYLQTGLSTVYFLAHSFTLMAFVMYISSLFNLNENTSFVRLVYQIPAAVVITSVFLNLYTGQIFYYDDLRVYHRGPYVLIIYFIALVYLFYAVHILARYTRQVQREKRWSLFCMIIFIVLSNFIQYFCPVLRVENFAVTLDALMVYLFIESQSNYIDSQTGLLSAESFFVHFNIAVKNHMGLKLLFLSLDDIDEWDREVGKATTDAAIVSVSGYLRSLSGVTEVYRMNRYLFLMHLSLTKEDAIEDLIENIRIWFLRSIVVGNYKIALANCTMRLDCPDQVMSETEMAGAVEMMSAVASHRNRREIRFDELGVEKHTRTRHIDLELREGIPHSRYRFGFQPIWSQTAKAFSHVDTDVSFMIDGVGEVRFSKVLSLAEQNGSIDEMYAFIVEEIASRIKRYSLAAYGVHTVDIKMPMTQLLKQETINRIIGIIDKYEIPHKMIIFELQEESLENYEGQIRSGIEQLNRRGFNFVLNNYGYGFTNAEILVKMPLVAVTLDNRLTISGSRDEKADRLLRSTMELLTGLGLRAKAEHIETEEQMAYARRLGCELLQGYYYVGLLYNNEIEDFFIEHNGGVGDAV